jgi:3-hydroxyacyl-CoA dehydrogenase
MTVHFELSDGIAVVTIDNPPVNAIGLAERCGLSDAMDKAVEAGAHRLIITGQGSIFVAGADAREFDAPPQAPHLNDILNRLAAFPIPVVSAINGVALGGGLEIALASHYRIASPEASLGLPEATLGVVPGAGGTQRLPRLVGVAEAVEMIASGNSIDAEKALSIGLVDELSTAPLNMARRMDAGRLKQAESVDQKTTPVANEAAISEARKQASRRFPGQTARSKAIDLVEISSKLPLSEALARERGMFLELRASAQARALRHVFFSERAALSQGRQFPRRERPIADAVVVGGGNMGAAIAYALATGGIDVSIIEMDDAGRGRAEANVDRLIDQGALRGLVTPDGVAALKSRIAYKIGYQNLKPVDLAIEAAFEDMTVKQAIFGALAAALPETTILATNTSYLDVNRLADTIPVPGRFVGLHFFSPAHIMKLLEIVRGDRTSPETLGAAFQLAKQLNKMPVLSGVCDGFIGNRILTRYRHAADILLLEGATPAQVDAAMRGFGMAMGPYAAQDMSGLDIAYANRQRQDLRSRTDIRFVPVVDRLVEDHGRLGRKSGAGWYDYAGEKPSPSPVVEEEIVRASREAAISRRSLSDMEIVERILLAMIAEAIDILEEGIAARPRDIDLVLVHGYGFPRWRGGLMHYADTLAPGPILNEIRQLAKIDPLSWKDSPLLDRLVRDGRSFDSLNQTALGK